MELISLSFYVLSINLHILVFDKSLEIVFKESRVKEIGCLFEDQSLNLFKASL